MLPLITHLNQGVLPISILRATRENTEFLRPKCHIWSILNRPPTLVFFFSYCRSLKSLILEKWKSAVYSGFSPVWLITRICPLTKAFLPPCCLPSHVTEETTFFLFCFCFLIFYSILHKGTPQRDCCARHFNSWGIALSLGCPRVTHKTFRLWFISADSDHDQKLLKISWIQWGSGNCLGPLRQNLHRLYPLPPVIVISGHEEVLQINAIIHMQEEGVRESKRKESENERGKLWMGSSENRKKKTLGSWNAWHKRVYLTWILKKWVLGECLLESPYNLQLSICRNSYSETDKKFTTSPSFRDWWNTSMELCGLVQQCFSLPSSQPIVKTNNHLISIRIFYFSSFTATISFSFIGFWLEAYFNNPILEPIKKHEYFFI